MITKEVYYKLINCPRVPPEMGGILMGNGSIIDMVIVDLGIKESDNSSIKYIPNIEFLNRCISKLNRQGKDFFGMFHTHAPQWPELSNDDRYYIDGILNAMPSYIQQLYFPLVFPTIGVKGYRAQRKGTVIDIIDDSVVIINKREEISNERNK